MALNPRLQKLLRQGGFLGRRPPVANQEALPLPYSWILTNSLAIGPMPRQACQWEQLEEAGFRARFSCCYPEEEQFSPVPDHWQSLSLALPDHRNQEELRPERLLEALHLARGLLHSGSPVYLHCFAGRERSPLIGVGLTALERQIVVFAALDWVRRCHPAAMPIYEQLDLLDQLLRDHPEMKG